MKNKPKKCKGINTLSKGLGCGVETLFRKYGLCSKCYRDFLLNTKQGQEIVQKAKTSASRKVNREISKSKKREKDEAKINLMSANQYKSKILQPVINELARLIDHGMPCIATGNYGKMNGGHFYSVGANPTISLNLHNIHIQSFESNHFKSGDLINYRNGLISVYGLRYFEFIESLSLVPVLKLNKAELIEIHKRALVIRKNLRNTLDMRLPKSRILLRNEINLALGVYTEKYSVFQ